MEKRTLLAVLLMFLVLLIWNSLFLKKTPPTQIPQQAPPEEVAPSDTTHRESVPVRIVPGIAEAETLTIESPIYTALLSTRGGVITSFKLHDYLTADGKPVELVPQGDSIATDSLPLAVALHLKTGERIDLSAAKFEASIKKITLAPGESKSLELTLVTPEGLKVRKTIAFSADSYLLDFGVEIEGPGRESIRSIEIGWYSGLNSTEPNRKDDLRNFAALAFGDNGFVKESLGSVRKHKEMPLGAQLKWTGVKTKYFLAALAAKDGIFAVARAFPRGKEAVGVAGEVDLKGQEATRFALYVGPLDYESLKAMGLGLEKAVDFGWRWIRPLSKLVFAFMLLVHKVVPNYGLVIIILSSLTKFLFYPLTQKSMKSMREMQRLQPELEKLREKYKNDPQKLNRAMLELYRERGINPLGGCLPMLLQMPFFIALFNVLSRTIELRRAGFVLWIKDLSVPDVVARLPFSLPFIGNAVSVLPILMGIAMFIQQKMTTRDPRQATMTYFMPIIFTVLFYRFPSGLVLYWLINNVLTIVHQYMMARSE